MLDFLHLAGVIMLDASGFLSFAKNKISWKLHENE